ncbi:hypothetical protein FB451DRAFT_1167917 [Mycena latifolia]|nr:hypothetical protein FB451DRAFT_1167917 [Mycena latifolia]
MPLVLTLGDIRIENAVRGQYFCGLVRTTSHIFGKEKAAQTVPPPMLCKAPRAHESEYRPRILIVSVSSVKEVVGVAPLLGESRRVRLQAKEYHIRLCVAQPDTFRGQVYGNMPRGVSTSCPPRTLLRGLAGADVITCQIPTLWMSWNPGRTSHFSACFLRTSYEPVRDALAYEKKKTQDGVDKRRYTPGYDMYLAIVETANNCPRSNQKDTMQFQVLGAPSLRLSC